MRPPGESDGPEETDLYGKWGKVSLKWKLETENIEQEICIVLYLTKLKKYFSNEIETILWNKNRIVWDTVQSCPKEVTQLSGKAPKRILWLWHANSLNVWEEEEARKGAGASSERTGEHYDHGLAWEVTQRGS